MGLFYAAIPVGCAYLFFDYLLITVYGYHPFAAGFFGGETNDAEQNQKQIKH
jgi:hypothetical protein